MQLLQTKNPIFNLNKKKIKNKESKAKQKGKRQKEKTKKIFKQFACKAKVCW